MTPTKQQRARSERDRHELTRSLEIAFGTERLADFAALVHASSVGELANPGQISWPGRALSGPKRALLTSSPHRQIHVLHGERELYLVDCTGGDLWALCRGTY